MNASDIRDELKHIRLIHFTLTTLSGTMFYLIIAAWTISPQLYSELLKLEDFLGRFQSGEVLLREIDDSKAIEIENKFFRDLENLLSAKEQRRFIAEYELPLHCIQADVKVDLQKSSLSELIDRFVKDSCKFLTPEKVEGDVADVQFWIKKSMQFEFGISKIGPFISRFKLAPDSKQGSGNHASATLAIVYRPVGGNDPDLRTAASTTIDEEVNLMVTLNMKSYSFTNDWFKERFPHVIEYYDAIKARSFLDALNWAREQRTKEINSLRVPMLGFEVKSVHVGAVGPLVIGAMLLYLLAYIRHCVVIMPEQAKTAKESVRFISPWLGAQHTLGLIITATTVALLPAAVTALSFFRLLGWSLFSSVVFGFLIFSIGAQIVLTGHQLGDRKVETLSKVP